MTVRRAMRARLSPALWLLAFVACGCSSGTSVGASDGGALSDLASLVPISDGGSGARVFAEVSFSGCPAIGVDGGRPYCTGYAPLEVTLVPVAPGDVTRWQWTLDGGLPGLSAARSPTVVWPLPGSYEIQLAVGGAGGEASARAEVDVRENGTGGPCHEVAQCEQGNRCICNAPDGGVACPGELADGLCTQTCTGGSCSGSSACVDLSRSVAGDPSVAMQPFRRALCLAACAGPSDCRPGFACRELPVLAAGAIAGGAFTWRKVCFASAVLGDVGHACVDGGGKLTPSLCTGGLCAPLGVRGICSSPCDAAPCPTTAACATFSYDPMHPYCVARCDAQHPCTDPLLDCHVQKPDGSYGYLLPQGEPKGGTYCTPRICTANVDCAPAGHCAASNSGPSYCIR